MKNKLFIRALFIISINTIFLTRHRLIHAQVETNEYWIPSGGLTPGFEGQFFDLYLREKVMSNLTSNPNTDYTSKTVLFIHGFSVSGEVVFDPNIETYSWMEALANQGFDVFMLNLTGYGRSEKPLPMNDSCNLDFFSKLALDPPVFCSTVYPFRISSAESEIADIKSAIEFIKQMRNVNQVHLIGHSLGGGRSLLYTASYPNDVERLIVHGFGVLNQNYASAQAPNPYPSAGNPVAIYDRQRFEDWANGRECDRQLDTTIVEALWQQSLASDSLGLIWDQEGIVRYPTTMSYGLTLDTVQLIQQPVLLMTGEFDNLGTPSAVGDLFQDLTTAQKVFIEIAFGSHSIYWETMRNHLFERSAEWLLNGSIDGQVNNDAVIDMTGTLVWGNALNDNSAPDAVQFNPENMQANVPLTLQTLELQLDESIFSLERYATIYRANGLTVKEFIDLSNPAKARITCPNTLELLIEPLEPNTQYIVTIDEDAFRDRDFNDFEGILDACCWTFSTGLITALPNTTIDAEMVVYPNPTNEYLHIQNKNQLKSIRGDIFSIDGKKILTFEQSPVNVEHFAPGVYIIRCMNEGALHHLKFTKN